MDLEHDRRINDEVTRKVVNVLDYLDQHKESIVDSMTSGVKIRELIAAGFIFGGTIMGMTVFMLNQHAEHPHKGAVHKTEFHRAMDAQRKQLDDLAGKLDRIIERGLR